MVYGASMTKKEIKETLQMVSLGLIIIWVGATQSEGALAWRLTDLIGIALLLYLTNKAFAGEKWLLFVHKMLYGAFITALIIAFLTAIILMFINWNWTFFMQITGFYIVFGIFGIIGTRLGWFERNY